MRLPISLDVNAEEQLVGCACAGDKQAYAVLVRTYSKYVFAICFGVVGNLHNAEDLAQQTLLKGFTEIRKIRLHGKFKSWIGQIARNASIDYLRRQKRQESVFVENFRGKDNDLGRYAELQAALTRLQENFRLPLVLYYLDGRSIQEIANILHVSQNAVYVRMARARESLRKLLTAEGEGL